VGMGAARGSHPSSCPTVSRSNTLLQEPRRDLSSRRHHGGLRGRRGTDARWCGSASRPRALPAADARPLPILAPRGPPHSHSVSPPHSNCSSGSFPAT
jgi:hypothetical protein